MVCIFKIDCIDISGQTRYRNAQIGVFLYLLYACYSPLRPLCYALRGRNYQTNSNLFFELISYYEIPRLMFLIRQSGRQADVLLVEHNLCHAMEDLTQSLGGQICAQL